MDTKHCSKGKGPEEILSPKMTNKGEQHGQESYSGSTRF